MTMENDVNSTMLQLNPPLPVVTPKGKAMAHILIDYGPEHDLIWTCFQDNNEIWCWRNQDVRAEKNTTFNRPSYLPT
jgi:hypothetical protein